MELHGGVGGFYTFVEFGNNQFELRPWQGVRVNWPSIWIFDFKEYFHLGEANVEAFRNRARLYIGIGQKVGGPWVVEAQFMLQTSRSTANADFTLNQETLRIRFIRRGRLPWWGLLPGTD